MSDLLSAVLNKKAKGVWGDVEEKFAEIKGTYDSVMYDTVKTLQKNYLVRHFSLTELIVFSYCATIFVVSFIFQREKGVQLQLYR